MEMSPQRVRGVEFKTVRKGADHDEVKAFLNEVADELERAQNQSTAMEARARAAVARLQEAGEASSAPAVPVAVDASVHESETISRTLLLAQRTADTTVAEASAEAERLVSTANDEASTTLGSTREQAAQMLDQARVDARQAGESERQAVASEVEALKARRDFLESDVEQLEIFMADQRNRVREAATSLLDVTDRVPGGLGEVRTPLLSAADDDVDERERTAEEAEDAADEAEEVAEAADDDLLIVTDLADSVPAEPAGDLNDDPWRGRSDESIARSEQPTAAMPVIDSARASTDDGFRFSFDDDER